MLPMMVNSVIVGDLVTEKTVFTWGANPGGGLGTSTAPFVTVRQ